MQAAINHLLMAARPHLDFNDELDGIPQQFIAMANIAKQELSGGSAEMWCLTVKILLQILDDQRASSDLLTIIEQHLEGEGVLELLWSCFMIAGETPTPFSFTLLSPASPFPTSASKIGVQDSCSEICGQELGSSRS